MDSKEKICRRIRIVQTILGLDQSKFAGKLGVTQAAVSRYTKDRIPKLEILNKIVDLANKAGENEITVDWVLNGGSVKASTEPSAVREKISTLEFVDDVAKDIENQLVEIMKIIKSSDFHRNLFYDYIHRSKQRTLLESLNGLSDEQIELVLKLVEQLKK